MGADKVVPHALLFWLTSLRQERPDLADRIIAYFENPGDCVLEFIATGNKIVTIQFIETHDLDQSNECTH